MVRSSSRLLPIAAVVVLGIGVVYLVAGSPWDGSPGETAVASSAGPVIDGAELYTANCAACHGANLEGVADWKKSNPDGSLKPPPHDSSGHTWHHGDPTLLAIIANGGGFPETKMPAFGDKLTDAEMVAILEFIKTSWGPDEREFQREATVREVESES